MQPYEGVEKLYTELESAGRPLEIVSLNAGVGVGADFTRETYLQRELDIINVNVTSTVRLANRVVKDMVSRNQGRTLITSSIAGQAPSPLEAVYGASKPLLTSFADALRNELKRTNVKIPHSCPNRHKASGRADRRVRPASTFASTMHDAGRE